MQPRSERQKILWAVFLSLLLHLIVGVSIASFGDKLQPSLPEEEKPVELTIMELAPRPTPPSGPKSTPFIDTTKQTATKEEPEEKTFESNANSIGASELPALGIAPIPTQEGKQLPTMDLTNRQHSMEQEGSQSQPPVSHPPASSAYRREQIQERMAGNISKRGVSSVNAVGTPLGRYEKKVYDAIGKRWYALCDANRDRVDIGTVHVQFVVAPNGKINDIKVTSGGTSASFTNLCLQSIQEAKPETIPEDVMAVLPPEGLPGEISFTGFQNP